MSAVMQDARDLAKWAEPNSLVLNDERAEAAVLRSFGARSSDEAEQPYLRPCDPRRPAMLLVDAIINAHREYRRHCDRCGGGDRPEHRLWVIGGESVSELAACDSCRRVLDFSCGNLLVWR